MSSDLYMRPSFLIDNEYYIGMLMLGFFGRISRGPEYYTEILPETVLLERIYWNCTVPFQNLPF